MYRIFLERAAEKDLHRLSSEVHDRVITASTELNQRFYASQLDIRLRRSFIS